VKVERVRPGVLRVTMHAYEMASLVAAARWATQGAPGELPTDAVDRIRAVLASYDEELGRSEDARPDPGST
jgi:hypothetical protein